MSWCAMQLGNLGVFYKQRDNLFYRVSEFTLPVTFLRIPYSIVCAGIWSFVVYWSCGLAPGADRFVSFTAKFDIHLHCRIAVLT